MMKILFYYFCISCLSAISVFAQSGGLNIIPQPQTVVRHKGEFKLNYKTKIVATDEAGRKSAGILNDLLLKNYGFKLEYTDKPPKSNAIIFAPQGFPVGNQAPESYGLTVSPKSIQIIGGETGQFYALQTFLQLLPVNFKGEARLAAVDISDEPRFSYRGMHLDVARHFMPVSFVKKFIDLMAQYKFNQFHWHLTEDQGWRIEIKKYPKLTEIGSTRTESHQGSYLPTFKGDGIPIEGFYRQEEIKDVVAYAKARKINIIPEIELPGHASAALAAYPQFGCKADYKYEVKKTWGIFEEVFCPTDETFKFLEDVLAETIALFPDSPYIHIGGDEVLKEHWKKSAFMQDLMKRENLKDEHEVQSYFIRRIEKFVNSKGKKIIGWDEILEGGVAPNATIMSWRGEKGGTESAKAKHEVIMTPNTFLYFDYGQGDAKYEPLNIGGYLTLEKVYSYNPIPPDLSPDEKKYILGAQANLWTEYLKTPEKVEYMAFPRMLALSEVNWSPLDKKDYTDFQKRLAAHFPRLDKQNVSYRIPEPKGLQNILVTGAEDKAKVELAPTTNGRIFYTLNGNAPDENSAEYKGVFEVALNLNEKKELKIIVVTANGRKSVIYTATLLRRPYLEPIGEIKDKNKYVNFAYYKSAFKSVSEMDKIEPTEKGTTKSIGLMQFAKKQKPEDPFGLIFDGLLTVESDGIYEFALESDDGAVLTIGEELAVDNDGLHAPQIKNGLIPLRKGLHRIRLKYIQGGGGSALSLRWGLKGTALRRIDGSELRN